MKHETLFTAPSWANGYDDVDVSDSFPDFDPDGEGAKVTAIYSAYDSAYKAADPSHEVMMLDGIRVVQDGLTMWHDRADCLALVGREEVHSLDAYLSQQMEAAL